ncbi:uncharacterized protein [Hyperolius riggenbachi]|uniref:uncharacterized protein n=1 Tax=Hyperolius riggenbachi TaxID=752182 RepID=UPI0035A3BC7B
MDPVIFYSYYLGILSFLLFTYYYVGRRRAPRRRWWVHPLLARRQRKGEFQALYRDLRRHPQKFYSYTLMSIPLFDTLLEMVKDDLRKKDTTFRRAVTPQEQLLITLRYMATGQTYTSLHVTFRIGKSTVAGIVVRTSRIIWTRLRARYMPVPDTKKWEEIAQGFWTECKFPNCVGALDGKHIRIEKPLQD